MSLHGALRSWALKTHLHIVECPLAKELDLCDRHAGRRRSTQTHVADGDHAARKDEPEQAHDSMQAASGNPVSGGNLRFEVVTSRTGTDD